ncbi:MAG: cold-shock protein [Candidatus Actinomarinales bacterium]|nr:MAG: cold-shock protein [Candidatus Actinomarinales bacterium]
MAQGIIKSYDPNTGVGIVLDEETREDLVLNSDSLNGSIFITLRQGQRVNYTKIESEGEVKIIKIKIGQDKY